MVKLLVLSDLHVEFAPFEPDPQAVEAADVVVLAGDIHKGVSAIKWARESFGDKPIVYVAGNHEFYGQKWFGHLEALCDASRKHGIHFLENEAVDIAGVRFLGCSLWTDFELFGVDRKPYAMRAAQRGMNDFRLIKVEKTRDVYWVRSGRLQPGLTVLRHRHSVEWLEQALVGADPCRTVVVTHHAPQSGSVAPQFAQDPLTPAFASDLTRMMGKAALWIHGHMHDSSDYTIDGTRVVCNPRGYPLTVDQFDNDSFDPGLIVEIPAQTRVKSSPMSRKLEVGSASPEVLSRQASALTKAVLRSAQDLGLPQQDLAAVLGTDDTTIGRFANEEQCLRSESYEWGAAAMLVELHMALFRLLGGNEVQMRAWMAGYNRALDAAPLQTIRTLEGLGRTLDYVHAAGVLP